MTSHLDSIFVGRSGQRESSDDVVVLDILDDAERQSLQLARVANKIDSLHDDFALVVDILLPPIDQPRALVR